MHIRMGGAGINTQEFNGLKMCGIVWWEFREDSRRRWALFPVGKVVDVIQLGGRKEGILSKE